MDLSLVIFLAFGFWIRVSACVVSLTFAVTSCFILLLILLSYFSALHFLSCLFTTLALRTQPTAT